MGEPEIEEPAPSDFVAMLKELRVALTYLTGTHGLRDGLSVDEDLPVAPCVRPSGGESQRLDRLDSPLDHGWIRPRAQLAVESPAVVA